MLPGFLGLSLSLTVSASSRKMSDGTMFDAEYYAQANPDVIAIYETAENALFFSSFNTKASILNSCYPQH